MSTVLDAPEGATDTSATLFVFEVPNIEPKVSVELTEVPAEARQHLLRQAVRNYVTNRVNAAYQRYAKSPWATYDKAKEAWDKAAAAHKADALTAPSPGDAPKAPEGERPAAPDLVEIAGKAKADLLAGNVQTRTGGGERAPRKQADPLLAAITKAVRDEVFKKTRATNAQYKWPDVVKEVPDGLTYLNERIAERVAAGGDLKTLEKMRDERYVKPVRIMLGLETPKALAGIDALL